MAQWAARDGWSGWSMRALNRTSTPSPAKCSMLPPEASMIGTTAAQYVFSMPITSVGSRVSLNEVKEARSAKSAVTVRVSPPRRVASGVVSRRVARCWGRYG